jgi:hypothetical protein
MPFSSGAVSYKSSTTESSTGGGLEEATISCGVTAAAAEGRGELAVQGPKVDPMQEPFHFNSALMQQLVCNAYKYTRQSRITLPLVASSQQVPSPSSVFHCCKVP